MAEKTRLELLEKYKRVGCLSDGVIHVCDKEGNWFHILPDGTPAYKERYKWVSPFSSGRAQVCDKDDKWFHIRPDGTKID